MANSCCACLTNVPSLALIICAIILLVLLLATVPIVFALTYQKPAAQVSEETANVIVSGRQLSDIWLEERIDDLKNEVPHASNMLPKNVETCPGFGFVCTNYPVSCIIYCFFVNWHVLRVLSLERISDVMETQIVRMDLMNWIAMNVKQLFHVSSRRIPNEKFVFVVINCVMV